MCSVLTANSFVSVIPNCWTAFFIDNNVVNLNVK